MTQGPARVVDLAGEHEVSRPAISKHLRVLAEARLVSVTDRGRERHYRLDRDGLRPVRDLLDELASAPPIAEHAFDGLELEVRRTVRERRVRGLSGSTTTTPRSPNTMGRRSSSTRERGHEITDQAGRLVPLWHEAPDAPQTTNALLAGVRVRFVHAPHGRSPV